MRTELLDFDVPRELIATEPVSPRDAARLLVCSRSDASRVEHRLVRDLPELLARGDRLVFNTTRVLPARLLGENKETGGATEALFLDDLGPVEAGGTGTGEGAGGWGARWRVMIKAKRARAGRTIALFDPSGEPTRIEMTLRERVDGGWVVEVRDWAGESGSTLEALERVGRTPLPPYIRGARKDRGVEHTDEEDRAWYQTAYAHEPAGMHPEQVGLGSVAAPTAGLHFTPGLLERLGGLGVERSEVSLHVGAGTFQPIEADEVEGHDMHSEWCSLEASGRAALEQASARDRGEAVGRVIPVGSTSARTLESFAGAGRWEGWLSTSLMIAPGYKWRVADGLLTNFHLPRSTLLAMVASLFGAGEDGVARLRAVYDEAVRERYRFFSYGDAMLVLP
ncbi:MAG: tRNA preQ1(34) S-adenosylmethionine ribosyltransferase-isomerase QueA [Phycisphaerales bacterium JB040]